MRHPHKVKAGAHEYPRPMLQRDHWQSLDGPWEFAIDADARWTMPGQVRWDRRIVVPFAPETPASGVHETGWFTTCWYRRQVTIQPPPEGRRIILHFGAIDYQATVWVNGFLAATHEGGYTPFSADITDLLRPGGKAEIVVRAEDDPADLSKPRGKQDWLRDPHSIWYYRTTGIWQTVWLEEVPATRIASLAWSCCVQNWQVALRAAVTGAAQGHRLRLRLFREDRFLLEDTYAVADGGVARRIDLPDPGIDDARTYYLWGPERPTLLPAELHLLDEAGRVVDAVRSYTAMRSVSAEDGRFMLNGRPMKLRMVLDQGYWPRTGLTSPDDAALRQDVELAKAMGFNGVRKHQKIEDPRYLWWADRLGLLVWEEMPSAYAFNDTTVRRLTTQWPEAIRRDASHPCIVAWVPFNESWGVPDLPHCHAHRDFVCAMYHLTRALDPTRPVVSNDGWENLLSDLITIHDYEGNPSVLGERYRPGADALAHLLRHVRPAGRALVLDNTMAERMGRLPVLLTEFGGIALAADKTRTWGYSRVGSRRELAERYTALLEAVRSLEQLSGWCYTQFTDTYQEANGLLTMDRQPKFPLDQIALATQGPGQRPAARPKRRARR